MCQFTCRLPLRLGQPVEDLSGALQEQARPVGPHRGPPRPPRLLGRRPEDVEGRAQVGLVDPVGPPDGVAHRVQEGADLLHISPLIGPEMVFSVNIALRYQYVLRQEIQLFLFLVQLFIVSCEVSPGQ